MNIARKRCFAGICHKWRNKRIVDQLASMLHDRSWSRLFSLAWAFCLNLVPSGPSVSARSDRLNKQTNTLGQVVENFYLHYFFLPFLLFYISWKFSLFFFSFFSFFFFSFFSVFSHSSCSVFLSLSFLHIGLLHVRSFFFHPIFCYYFLSCPFFLMYSLSQ